MPHATIHHATEAFKERLWLCRSNNFPFRLLWYATYKKFFILAFCVRFSAQLSMDMWKRMKVINSTRKTDMYCKKLIWTYNSIILNRKRRKINIISKMLRPLTSIQLPTRPKIYIQTIKIRSKIVSIIGSNHSYFQCQPTVACLLNAGIYICNAFIPLSCSISSAYWQWKSLWLNPIHQCFERSDCALCINALSMIIPRPSV